MSIPLGGFFVALTGAVAIPVGIYAIGYAQRAHFGGLPIAVLPVFVAAMLLVPPPASVTTFLLAWELMAVASLVLVLAEHTRPEVRSAGLLYAVMTQLGFVAILIGLMVLSAAGGADRFAELTRAPEGARAAVFVADGGRVRVEGGSGAAARLAAARPPRGAEPGVGADERGDGQPRHLRHRPVRPAAARARAALVGAHCCWSWVRCPRCTGCCRPRWPRISNGCLPIRRPRTWA